MIVGWLVAGVGAGLAGLLALRLADGVADRTEARRLIALQPAVPPRFDPAMVSGLPEPARRFFCHAILPGTPLRRVARIEMSGRFGLGDRARPGYRPMRAWQVLAAPHGFVWAMRAGMISGSDSGRWTRFRIGGLLPVARQGGTADHARSAFGRHVAEALFWTPAAALPGPGVTWEAVDGTSARVTFRHAGMEQAVTVTVDDEGRAVQVSFPRWSDANAEGRWQVQPFGGILSDWREVAGFRLPFRVVAGNLFGTPDQFDFFLADVTAISFPAPDA